ARVAADVFDTETGEVLADAASTLTQPTIDLLMTSNVQSIQILHREDMQNDQTIVRTLEQDKTQTADEALREIYARIRPGDPATDATCRTFFQRLFFDASRYDFASVGRYKINRKLGLQIDQNTKTLTKE